jgi:hypothetical protein
MVSRSIRWYYSTLRVISIFLCLLMCGCILVILKLRGLSFNFYLLSIKVPYMWYQSSFLNKKMIFFSRGGIDFSREKMEVTFISIF